MVALTIWVALGGYTLALLRLLWARGGDQIARFWWTLGYTAYAFHMVVAFHFFYDWSHGVGIAETERQTEAMTGMRWGGGLYFNYLFTVIWFVDVFAWWWRGPGSYRTRPRWVHGTVHAFLFFMVFNGTVIFGSGASRLIGVGVTLLLGGAILRYTIACVDRGSRMRVTQDKKLRL